jgi:hypothetical protein
LIEIKQALGEKASIKGVEKDIFIAKTDLEKQIEQRVMTDDLPTILDKFERNIEFNTRKFVDVDRRVNDCKMVCENMSKSVSKTVNIQSYKADQKIIIQKFKETIQFVHLQKHLDYVNPTVND